jgi:hypothetical protein
MGRIGDEGREQVEVFQLLRFGPGDVTYYRVGRIDQGKYAGADLVTGLRGNGDYYTFVGGSGKYTMLPKYSMPEVDLEMSGDFETAPQTDTEYDIPELDYPQELVSPVKEIAYGNPSPIMGLDPNYMNFSSYKKIGTHPQWGDIYEGYDLSAINIHLPNGQFVTYALAEMQPRDISLGSRRLEDYEVGVGFYCDKAWSQAEHPEYYEEKNLQKMSEIHGLPVYEMSNQELLRTLYKDLTVKEETVAAYQVRDFIRQGIRRQRPGCHYSYVVIT